MVDPAPPRHREKSKTIYLRKVDIDGSSSHKKNTEFPCLFCEISTCMSPTKMSSRTNRGNKKKHGVIRKNKK